MNERSLFIAALEKDDLTERAAFLEAACAGNARLRQRLERLLQAHEQPDGFLNAPVAGPGMTVDLPITEKPGMGIGPYKLREQIGEGGMGLVFVAEQQHPVRRLVALKIIKPGLDSQQVIARFEAERQALALMDHQNIAKVFDAGTTESGRPYFVMELVHGVPITEYCDANQLTPRQRLELFVPVCQAIQHAHQKGIIHRDIKPSNVLVTLYDDKPVPKVIDFGVAKAIEQRLTEKSVYTQFGTLVGTFEYMSPEQAEMNAFGVDTRSDIYALGVLLYELLTGTTPLQRARLREAALGEIVRLIKEEEPQKPSVRLSTSGALAKVAAARKTEPGKLSRLMRGELDWVVMRCLEKDRSRRYDTASGLAKDVERYLKDEPVEARPPSLAYRIRKLTRRNRGLLTTVAAIAVVLVAGAAISIWQAVQATRSAHQAQAARQDAELAFQDADLARQEAVAAKEKVELAAKRLNTATQLANEGRELYLREHRTAALVKYNAAAEVEPNLLTVYVYRRTLYTDLGLWDLAAADYAQSFRLAPRNPALICFEHALLQAVAGDEQRYQEACQEFVRQYGDATNHENVNRLLMACTLSPRPVIERSDLIRWAEALAFRTDNPYYRVVAASAFLRAGDFRRTNELCKEYLVLVTRMADIAPHRIYAIQAMALHALGRPEEARQSLTKLEAAIDELTRERLGSPVGPKTLPWYGYLLLQHWHREAHMVLNGTPPPADPRLARLRERGIEVTKGDVHTYMAVGRQAVERKDWDEAATSFATAFEKMPLSYRGADTIRWGVEMVQQPEVFKRLLAKGNRVQTWPSRYIPVRILWSRGRVLANQREWAQAATHIAKALQLGEETRHSSAFQKLTVEEMPPRAPRTFFQFYVAATRLLAGDEKGYLEVCAWLVREAASIDNPDQAYLLSRALSLSPAQSIDRDLAIRMVEQALAKRPTANWYRYSLGAAYYRAGRYKDAITKLQEHLERDPLWLGRTMNYAVLAMAYHRLGRYEEAQEWLKKARAAFVEFEQIYGKGKYGFAEADCMHDWLEMLLLLPEAEKLLATGEKP